MIRGIITAFLVIISDQISKYAILNFLLQERMGIKVCEFFNIVRAWNTGVSFSMFNNYGYTGVIILSSAAIGVVLMLLYWLISEKDKTIQLALGLIMGGAIGNVIDRLHKGAVFDFLDFHINEIHWPAFNIADSCICIGAGIIIFQTVLTQVNKSKEK